MPTIYTADSAQWGPNLYAWLETYWRAHGTNANAWSDAHPGVSGATISRWKTGTVPGLTAMRAVADALGMSLVDVLTVAGVIREGETGARHVPDPELPSIDLAIDTDPTLSDPARDALRGVLNGIRRVESGRADEVRGIVDRRRGRKSRS